MNTKINKGWNLYSHYINILKKGRNPRDAINTSFKKFLFFFAYLEVDLSPLRTKTKKLWNMRQNKLKHNLLPKINSQKYYILITCMSCVKMVLNYLSFRALNSHFHTRLESYQDFINNSFVYYRWIKFFYFLFWVTKYVDFEYKWYWKYIGYKGY